MVVALTITIVLMAGVGSALISTIGVANELVSTASADNLLRRTLDRLVEELRFADSDSLQLDANGTTLTFATVTDWQGGGTVVGATQTLVFDSGEVLLNDQVIVGGITELSFEVTAESLTINATVDRSYVISGLVRTVTRRASTSVRL